VLPVTAPANCRVDRRRTAVEPPARGVGTSRSLWPQHRRLRTCGLPPSRAITYTRAATGRGRVLSAPRTRLKGAPACSRLRLSTRTTAKALGRFGTYVSSGMLPRVARRPPQAGQRSSGRPDSDKRDHTLGTQSTGADQALTVWLAMPPDLAGVIGSLGWSDRGDRYERAGRSWSAHATRPRPVAIDDAPEQAQALVAGISYAVEITLQGGSPAGEEAVRGAANAIARHGHGAVSPEDVSKTWAPRGVHRVTNHRLPHDGFDLLTLSWWVAGGPLVTPTGARRFFQALQKWLPEAMPARWDEFEASSRRAADENADGLPNVLDAIRDQVLVLAPAPPILTLDYHGWHWGPHPNDGFHANWVQIAIDGGLLSEPGWPKQLARAFEELTVVAQPFYAEARLRPGGIYDRSFGLAATTIHPIGRSCWRGFPHARPLAMAVGPPYVERWPRPTNGKERDGLLIFSSDDWPNAPREGIPQAPSEMLQQFDQRLVPGRYLIEGSTEPPEFWPFEWGKVVDHSTSGGSSELYTLVQSATRAKWEKAKTAAGAAGPAPASATPLPKHLSGDQPAPRANGRPAGTPTGREAFVNMVRTEVAPALRALGFIGTFKEFRLIKREEEGVLVFQASKWNTAERYEFTVNWFIRHRRSKKRRANIHAGRLGMLTPPMKDTWWKVGPAQPTSVTAQDLVAGIRDFGKVAMLMEMTYPDEPEPTTSWTLLREDPDGPQHWLVHQLEPVDPRYNLEEFHEFLRSREWAELQDGVERVGETYRAGSEVTAFLVAHARGPSSATRLRAYQWMRFCDPRDATLISVLAAGLHDKDYGARWAARFSLMLLGKDDVVEAEEESRPRPGLEQFYRRQIPVLPPGSTISQS